MQRAWMVSSVGMLLFFYMLGFAFGWVVGFGRFVSSLPLGCVVFSPYF